MNAPLVTRFVDAGSLFTFDTAYSFVNRFGEELDGYPLGPVEAVEQLKSADLPADNGLWEAGMRWDDNGYRVIPVTVTIGGVSFTTFTAKLGAEVAA